MAEPARSVGSKSNLRQSSVDTAVRTCGRQSLAVKWARVLHRLNLAAQAAAAAAAPLGEIERTKWPPAHGGEVQIGVRSPVSLTYPDKLEGSMAKSQSAYRAGNVST